MAGALTERDFVQKLERAGFTGIELHDRRSFGVDDLALYPLFTRDVLALMRELLSARRQRAVATAVVVLATAPAEAPGQRPTERSEPTSGRATRTSAPQSGQSVR